MTDLPAEAKTLMGNEAFKACVESARKYHIDKAMNCSPSNDLGRRHHLALAKDIDGIVSHLTALVAAVKTGEEVDPDNYYIAQAKARWSSAALASVNQ